MAVLTGSSAKRVAWAKWLGRCSSGTWANPQFFGRYIGGVPTPWADAIKALESALKTTGYTPVSAWAYNFRGIGGRTCTCSNSGSCSLHAYGIAIDIDPKWNPMISTGFSWSKTKFTPTQIAAVEAIKNTKGESIWEWGGRWKTAQDYMHFEARVDPGSTAVNWNTVVGIKPPTPKPPTIPQGDDEAMLPIRYGHGFETPPADSGLTGNQTGRKDDVKHIQTMVGITGTAADGVYGMGTAKAVAAKVGGTGKVVDGPTYTVLIKLVT